MGATSASMPPAGLLVALVAASLLLTVIASTWGAQRPAELLVAPRLQASRGARVAKGLEETLHGPWHRWCDTPGVRACRAAAAGAASCSRPPPPGRLPR